MSAKYQETLNYLFAQLPMYQRVGSVAFKKDLTNTLALSEIANNPHEKLKCIHVAGTNGKGSVSHIIAAVLQTQGYKVGLYTSPHYKDFRERIKINGTYISEEAVIEFVENNKKHFEAINPSFFEMTVVMAYDYFVNQQVDYAIIEVGLGGRLDSTNIITPLLSVITNISYDHTDMLGNTLSAIAFEKAGIIKHNVPVIIGETHPETEPVFYNVAKEKNASILFAEKENEVIVLEKSWNNTNINFRLKKETNFQYTTDLKGDYQLKNLNTALTALHYLNNNIIIKVDNEALSKGLKNVIGIAKLIGRFQVIDTNPLVIFDSAHNEGGLKVLMKEINEIANGELYIVFGTVKDKDLTKVLPILPKNAKYYFCKADIPRGLDAGELNNTACNYGLVGKVFKNSVEALNEAKKTANKNDIVLVTGSIFVVAELV
jgi:dihydrofolate synthase/folylpolyglutamate synthase